MTTTHVPPRSELARRFAANHLSAWRIGARVRLAQTSADPQVHAVLTGDRSKYVRQQLAGNPQVGEATLLDLATDPFLGVAHTVSDRLGVSAAVLAVVFDSNGSAPARELNRIAYRVVHHPDTTAETLRAVYATTRVSSHLRGLAALHQNARDDAMLREVLTTPGAGVLYDLAWRRGRAAAGWFSPAFLLTAAADPHRAAELDEMFAGCDRRLFAEMAAGWAGSADELIVALGDVAALSR